ncbi:alpha/beta hydrolase [Paenibacillus woosongensis]|uniref:Alpha/beta fold hydrolase n=1 Tax=Paenibacillus woosongensis TaxID=307580 RepID=A0A7X3CPX9_9BACL|nr:alpha/beta hydrolase [Paenibacillus woosongensis]MUG46515.1 alpha/beta fold hydrolase [Paenibacillus woosongensis]
MIYTVLVAIILVVILAASFLTRFGFRQITQMKLQTYENIFDYLEKTGIYSRERFETLDKKEVKVTSKDGLSLSGYVLDTDPASKKWVIIVHGYTVSSHVSAQYVDMFQQEGFNVLLIDQRRHGNSEGTYTTYGYHEKYDVQIWVDWLLDHYGRDITIGLHGQSFGGGTVLEYLSIAHPNVKFVIADCPYSDLTELMRYQLQVLNKIPAFPLLSLIDRQLERKAGFRLKQVSPLKAVEQSSLPVMFVHGTEDRYVPTHMSKDLYEHKPEPKRLLLVDGAVHADAYSVDPKRYSEEVHSFIREALATPAAKSCLPSI